MSEDSIQKYCSKLFSRLKSASGINQPNAHSQDLTSVPAPHHRSELLGYDIACFNATPSDLHAADHKCGASIGCEGGIISADEFERNNIVIIEKERDLAA